MNDRLLLFDIGNTHTHLGVGGTTKVLRQANVPTRDWHGNLAAQAVRKFLGSLRPAGVALCSVVPQVTSLVERFVWETWKLPVLELSPGSISGIGIRYPRPETIGPDRLANAMAAKHHYGAPVVVVDFGTAVTFDVVDAEGNYVGGIITPGLSAMTDYLHEKTALLPRIRIREVRSVIGKNTEQAMLIGAVHGYRGLVRELIMELRKELACRKLPVVATGGYARLMAAGCREITSVAPNLTLEGLRLMWQAQSAGVD